MPFVLHVIGLAASSNKTPFDGLYVKEYDPTWHLPDGCYDGGKLLCSVTPATAKCFDTPGEALMYYQQSYGTRPDGMPNRPLTAFTVEIKEQFDTEASEIEYLCDQYDFDVLPRGFSLWSQRMQLFWLRQNKKPVRKVRREPTKDNG